MQTGWKWALGAFVVALAGCGGSDNSGLLNEPQPRLRVVNGIPGVSGLNVTVASTTVVASNLGYGQLSTPYAIVPRGAQNAVFANASAPSTPLFTLSKTFTFNDRFDAVAYGSSATTHVVLLADSLANGTNGSYRIVNGSSTNATVDVFFTTVGAPLTGAVNLAPGAVGSPGGTTSDYYTAGISTATSYEIRVFPGGSDTGTPLIDQTVTLSPTDRKTFIVLDPAVPGNSYVLVTVQDNNAS